MDPANAALPPLVLNATERRVLGVLIEKGLTTPEYYPLTVKALVAGCNQKNNRDPVTDYDEAQVGQALDTLTEKGLVMSVMGDAGRVARWRQELARKLELSAVEMAVLGELLLRGAQSEGDVRGRASRMRPLETLDALREVLDRLRAPTAARPALVVRLSAEGAARGVRWTHALQPAERIASVGHESPVPDLASTPPSSEPARAQGGRAARDDGLLARIAALEERVAKLEEGVRSTAGGA